jgi:4-methylaminobutanoate oxidase (formaldehyde-forming)
LLQSLTPDDLSHKAFPFASSREIELGLGYVRASRITFVGELGWELYIPTEFMQDIYDRIILAGQDFGLVHAGYHALNSLRLEKAYRHWSHDITDEDSPLEAGLGFVIKFDKPQGFIGREALLRQQEKGLSRQLLQLKLCDPQPLIYHNEPIWRDGILVGHITSGAYGHTLGGAVGLGYVETRPGNDNETLLAGSYEVEVACERVPAQVSLTPLYDPKNSRIRA